MILDSFDDLVLLSFFFALQEKEKCKKSVMMKKSKNLLTRIITQSHAFSLTH